MKKPLNQLHAALLLLRKIPRGYVVSYKELARTSNTSPRAVGQILRRNPRADICPCYRVVKSSGEIGGFSGKSEGRKIREKVAMLENDGIAIKNNKIDKKYFWKFS